MKLRYSVIVRKPVDEVFRFIATDYFENRPRWSPEDAQLVEKSDGPMQVGSEARAVAKDKYGRAYERSLVVTEYVPSSRFSTESTIALLIQQGTTLRHYPTTKSKATMAF